MSVGLGIADREPGDHDDDATAIATKIHQALLMLMRDFTAQITFNDKVLQLRHAACRFVLRQPH
ncbi:hypothetical protein KCP73_14925 [Salmonella enterica subsp. enterica]|nr:hypothetical protein KCP73_14925 [Salmonella enterica subsp. enterica]